MQAKVRCLSTCGLATLPPRFPQRPLPAQEYLPCQPLARAHASSAFVLSCCIAQASNVFTRGEIHNMLVPALLAPTPDATEAQQRAALMQASGLRGSGQPWFGLCCMQRKGARRRP